MSLLNELKDVWKRSQTPEALERVYVTQKDRGGHTHMLNDSKCALLIGAQSRASHTPVLDNSDTRKGDPWLFKGSFYFPGKSLLIWERAVVGSRRTRCDVTETEARIERHWALMAFPSPACLLWPRYLSHHLVVSNKWPLSREAYALFTLGNSTGERPLHLSIITHISTDSHRRRQHSFGKPFLSYCNKWLFKIDNSLK